MLIYNTQLFWVENHVISRCQGLCPPAFSSAEKGPGNEVERKSCTGLSLWAWATWWTIQLDFVEIGTLGVCKEFGYWVRQRVPVRASTTYRWVLDRYRCASTMVSSPRRVKRDGASNGLYGLFHAGLAERKVQFVGATVRQHGIKQSGWRQHDASHTPRSVVAGDVMTTKWRTG